MGDAKDGPSAAKKAGAIALVAILLALTAVGVVELIRSFQSGSPEPIGIALAPPANAPSPATEPAGAPNPISGAFQDAIQHAIALQLGANGPLSKMVAWNLSTHPPGQRISAHWKQTLAGGITVEMIAVGHPDENPGHWWDGDGRPVSMLPQWGRCVGVRGYVLRVIYPQKPDEGDATIERTIGGSTSIFNTDGEGNAEIFFTAPAPTAGQPLSAQIGVGRGEWKPLATLDDSKIGLQPLSTASAEHPAFSMLTLSYTPSADVERAWAAVDKAGKTHWITSEGPISSRPAGDQSVTERDYLPLAADHVDHVVAFSRPRVWTQFTGMADAPVKSRTAPARIIPSTGPATAPASIGITGLLNGFANANGNVKVKIEVDPEFSGMNHEAVDSRMQLARSHLHEAASSAFGEIAARKALSGICEPPPDLLLITGVAQSPRTAHDTPITAMRLDGQTWKYDVLPPGFETGIGGVAETPADHTARVAARLDAIAGDVEAGNYQTAAAMRAALLRQIDRMNAPPTTRPGDERS